MHTKSFNVDKASLSTEVRGAPVTGSPWVWSGPAAAAVLVDECSLFFFASMVSIRLFAVDINLILQHLKHLAFLFQDTQIQFNIISLSHLKAKRIGDNH
jgi:hypothetical protein